MQWELTISKEEQSIDRNHNIEEFQNILKERPRESEDCIPFI